MILSSDFTDRDIALSLGLIEAEVSVFPSDTHLLNLLDQSVEARIQAFNGQPASSDPQISATRKAYKALGKDPARYRPAAEALTRRILQGKGLYRVNNLVDINNLISIESGISIGTYARAKISGEITFRRATSGESYKGIGRDLLNLEGLPVFCDDLGPFGCPTSDSERTMITSGDHPILMVLICFGQPDVLPDLLEKTADLLKKYGGATNLHHRILSNT